MNYTVSVSALWETCVCTLQTSEPRIHLGMPRTDGPEGSGDRGPALDTVKHGHINDRLIPVLAMASFL